MSEPGDVPGKPNTQRRHRVRENWKPLKLTVPLRSFVDYAWDNYDAKAVAAYLLDSDKSFYRHKSILHEGFCAWVACPARRKLREDGMVYRIAKAVEDAEAPWREGASAFNRSVGEFVGRTLRADRRFFEELHHPVGGAARIGQAMSRIAFKRALSEHATDMLEAVHLMALHHYHLTHLRDKKIYHIPSKDAGAALVKKAFGASTTRLFVEDLTVPNKLKTKERVPRLYKLRADTSIIASWSQSRPSVAYAYAAASIKTDGDRTLLHEIVSCKCTRAKHQHLMQEWFGRARYVVDSIIEQCHPEREPFDYRATLLNIEPIPFEVPCLFPFVPQVIAEGYKNAPVVKQEKLAKQITDLRAKSKLAN